MRPDSPTGQDADPGWDPKLEVSGILSISLSGREWNPPNYGMVIELAEILAALAKRGCRVHFYDPSEASIAVELAWGQSKAVHETRPVEEGRSPGWAMMDALTTATAQYLEHAKSTK